VEPPYPGSQSPTCPRATKDRLRTSLLITPAGSSIVAYDLIYRQSMWRTLTVTCPQPARAINSRQRLSKRPCLSHLRAGPVLFASNDSELYALG